MALSTSGAAQPLAAAQPAIPLQTLSTSTVLVASNATNTTNTSPSANANPNNLPTSPTHQCTGGAVLSTTIPLSTVAVPVHICPRCLPWWRELKTVAKRLLTFIAFVASMLVLWWTYSGYKQSERANQLAELADVLAYRDDCRAQNETVGELPTGCVEALRKPVPQPAWFHRVIGKRSPETDDLASDMISPWDYVMAVAALLGTMTIYCVILCSYHYLEQLTNYLSKLLKLRPSRPQRLSQFPYTSPATWVAVNVARQEHRHSQADFDSDVYGIPTAWRESATTTQADFGPGRAHQRLKKHFSHLRKRRNSEEILIGYEDDMEARPPLPPPKRQDNHSPSSTAGGDLRDSGSQQHQEAESELRQRYAVLRTYLMGGAAQPPSANNKARDKLLRLCPAQFHVLVTNVFDELQRWQAAQSLPGRPPRQDEVPPFLQPRPEYPEVRNRARQKLSSLRTSRRHDLVTDVFYELERRFPHFNPENQSFVPPPQAHTTQGLISSKVGFPPRQGSEATFEIQPNGADEEISDHPTSIVSRIEDEWLPVKATDTVFDGKVNDDDDVSRVLDVVRYAAHSFQSCKR